MKFQLLIFAFSFIWVLFCTLLLQFYIIPLSSIPSQNGLIIGGDWIGFHRRAEDLAELMRQEGYSNWELTPGGALPVGIASLVYALTGINQPYMLSPINALFSAISVSVLFNIAQKMGFNITRSFVSTLTVLTFPTFVSFWAQLHKDIFALAGILIFIRFWVFVVDLEAIGKVRFMLLEITFLFFGLFFIYSARSFLIEVLLVILIFFLFMRLVLFLVTASRDNSRKREIFLFNKIIKIVLISILALSLNALFVVMDKSDLSFLDSYGIGRLVNGGSRGTVLPFIEIESELGVDALSERQLRRSARCGEWEETMFIPTLIDARLRTLSCYRTRFLSIDHAGSTIDGAISFNHVEDIVLYLPRALQIALFAPFSNQLLASTQDHISNVMRKLVFFEMLVLYLSYIGIIFSFFYRGLDQKIIFIAYFVSLFGIIYALIVPNMGAFHRFSAPQYLLMVQAGILSWFRIFRQ